VLKLVEVMEESLEVQLVLELVPMWLEAELVMLLGQV